MSRVHHMVLFTMKPTAGADAVERLFAALEHLRQTLPGMAYFRGGANASPEGLNQGFTHGFLMTFTDKAARDHYLNHAEHEKVKGDFIPLLDKILVFDFEE